MKKIIFGLLFSTSLWANPHGPQVAHGSAEFSHNPKDLTISCAPDAIINWQSFNIDQGEKVTFVQPSNMAFVLNRVIGIEPSRILGTLSSNGALFLLNPNGLLIGEGANIHVGSLVASTLHLTDEDFLLRNFAFFEEKKTSITHLGEIQADGDIYLLSSSIENKGSITSLKGRVGLGAGSTVLVKPSEESSLYIQPNFQENSKEKMGLNLLGEINGSKIELKADGNLYELAINAEGKIDAQSLKQEGGTIYLSSDKGTIHIENGQLKAQKENEGGKIVILAEKIQVEGSSLIDVSHPKEGGSLLLGGGRSGQTLFSPNAKSILLEKEVVLDASSKGKGNGGEIVVWSEETTNFFGKARSLGGEISGNGGFVEVSGKNLTYEGLADLRANSGKMGDLLLDPSDITIGTALADTTISYSGGNPNTATATAATGVVGLTNLNANLNTANVIISTASAFGSAGTITVNCSAGNIAPTSTTHGSLTLRATSNILFGGASTITFQAAALASFTCIAGDPSIGGVNGDIQFNANLTLNNALSADFTASGTGIVTTTAAAAAKTITFSGVPTINLTGNSGITLGSTANAMTLNFGTSATSVTLATGAAGDIYFGQSVSAAGAALLTGGSNTVLTANSGRNILFSGGAGTYGYTTFGQINFNAPAGTISTTPLIVGGLAHTFTSVPTIHLTALNGITIGNNNTAFPVAINFGVACTLLNLTTTAAAADITFGQTAAGTGTTTLTGGSTTILTASAGRNLLFNIGTGAYNFTTFGAISFLANAGSISMTPLGAVTQTFTSVPTINYVGASGITLGQNATALAPIINFGNANTINMSTTTAATDIVFGGTGAAAATFNAGAGTTLNVTPTGKIVVSGTGATIGTFSGFGQINFFSSTATPTAGQVVEISRTTTTFSACNNLMMYPYNINFLASNTTTNISSSTLSSITAIDPLGITIPTTLTLNSNATNLSMTAPSFLINGKILSASTGSIALTSTTADITLQALLGVSARVGVNTGDVRINSARDLIVSASNTTLGFAQIGYDSAAVLSDIYLTVGRDVTLTGGNAALGSVYALIGHGAKAPAAGTRQGNIIINSVVRNLTMTAGATVGDTEGAVRLGHMSIDVAAGINLIGDIRGPTAGSRGVISGNIALTAGIGDQCKAHIGHGASNVTAGSVNISGNILLQCSNLDLRCSNAAAGTENFAGIGHKVRFGASGLSAVVTGSVDTKVLGNGNFVARGYGGAVLYGAYINNGPTFTSTGNIDFSLVNLDVAGFLEILGGTTGTPQENKVILGTYSDLVASYTRANMNLTVGSALTLISRTGDFNYIINGQTPTTGRTMNISTGNDLYLVGEGKSAIVYAIDTLNISCGRDLVVDFKSTSATDYTSIEANNNINIQIARNLSMFGYGINAGPLSNAGFSFIRNNSTTVGDITIIMGESCKMNPFSKMINSASGKGISVVLDNNYPTPWSYGHGSIDTEVFVYFTTTNNGPLRFFTADQSLNSIRSIAGAGSFFNGDLFTSGTPYVNTATEIWGTYYPSSLGGVPYTFFYKTRGPQPSPFPHPAVDLLQQDPSLLRPYYEMFHRPYATLFNILDETTPLRKDTPWAY
jgi:fibronectin-binding autotransporter adhesin